MRVLKRIVKVAVVAVIVTWLVVVMVRALFLPATACVVSHRAVEDLKLEIGFAAVRDALGCDGVLASRQVWSPKLTREVYHWRGDAWPFGRFEGLFYNGVLHGKDIRWITVDAGRTPGAVDAAVATPVEQPTKP